MLLMTALEEYANEWQTGVPGVPVDKMDKKISATWQSISSTAQSVIIVQCDRSYTSHVLYSAVHS